MSFKGILGLDNGAVPGVLVSLNSRDGNTFL